MKRSETESRNPAKKPYVYRNGILRLRCAPLRMTATFLRDQRRICHPERSRRIPQTSIDARSSYFFATKVAFGYFFVVVVLFVVAATTGIARGYVSSSAMRCIDIPGLRDGGMTTFTVMNGE